jgi:hypothetical protein
MHRYSKKQIDKIILEEYSNIINEQWPWEKEFWTDEYGPVQKFKRGAQQVGQDIKRAFTPDSETPKRFAKMKKDLARTVDPETWVGQGGIIDTLDKEGIQRAKEELGEAYETIKGILSTWQTWDGFIDGQYGLRPAAYSPGGIAASAVLSVIPYTRAIPSAVFGVLLADDFIKISEGKFGWVVAFNLLFDSIGIFTGGASSLGRQLLRDTKIIGEKVVVPVLEQLFRGASGQELQHAIMFLRNNLKLTKKFQEAMIRSGIAGGIKNFAELILRAINSFGSMIQDWLRSLMKYPVISEYAQYAYLEISEMLSTAKGFVRIFVDGMKMIINMVNAVVKYPGTKLDKLLKKIFGENVPEWLAKATMTGVYTYGMVKSLEWYQNFNEQQITEQQIADQDALQAENFNKTADELKKMHGRFTGVYETVDFIPAGSMNETKPKLNGQLFSDVAIDGINFSKHPEAKNAYVYINKFSSDGEYALITLWSPDPSVKPDIVWVYAEDVKYSKWKGDE